MNDRTSLWTNLEEQLSEWGHHLDRMKSESEKYREEYILELERQYMEIRTEFNELRQHNQKKLKEAQAQNISYSELLKRQSEEQLDVARENLEAMQEATQSHSERLASLTKEKNRQLNKSAEELGEGFANAWSELAKGFDKALLKLQ